MAKSPGGRDDGRRFTPEAVAILKRRVVRYRRRLNLTWLGLADKLSHWAKITIWFPDFGSTFCNSENFTDEEITKRTKRDQCWPITEQFLRNWILGYNRNGRLEFSEPDQAKLQNISSFMLEENYISEGLLSGLELDFRFLSELWSCARIGRWPDLSESWNGLYFGRHIDGPMHSVHELSLLAPKNDPISFASLETARAFRRPDESLAAFEKRLIEYPASSRTLITGWAIPLSGSALLVHFRADGIAGEKVVPALLDMNKISSGNPELVWMADLCDYLLMTNFEYNAILSFGKDNIRDEPDFEFRRPIRATPKTAETMQNNSRWGLVPATRDIDLNLLGSAWAGDAAGIQECLDRGANVNVYRETTFQTPLHLAIMAGQMDAIELLLTQLGIRIDVDDLLEKTPSELALVHMRDENLSQRLLVLEEAEDARRVSESPWHGVAPSPQ